MPSPSECERTFRTTEAGKLENGPTSETIVGTPIPKRFRSALAGLSGRRRPAQANPDIDNRRQLGQDVGGVISEESDATVET